MVPSEKPVLTPMSLRLLELLGVIVIFRFLFIAFFLFTHRKGKRLSNGLLGGFFLAVGLNLFDGLYVITGWVDANPHLACFICDERVV